MIETVLCTMGGTLIGVIIVNIIDSLIRRYEDKKIWNNGMCSYHNEPWRYIYKNKRGERVYTCNHGHWCEIYYNVDGRE